MADKILDDARACMNVALIDADPAMAVKKALAGMAEIPGAGPGMLAVAALGKASIPMAKAFIEFTAAKPDVCLAIHPSGISWDGRPDFVEAIAAGHPTPDGGSLKAGIRLGELADSLGKDDLLVLLISGGGSALACAPATGVAFEDKIETNGALLRSGEDINAVNCVRKHLSAIKGGRLAERAFPAKVVSLMISDVVGDDPSVIASGPVAPDRSTYREALAVCRKAGAPQNVIEFLERGVRGIEPETPKPGAPAFENVTGRIIASNRSAIAAAAAKALELGYNSQILTSELAGEARDAGEKLATVIKSAAPGAFIAVGGETTVTVKGGGRGGRCQELALAAAIELEGVKGCLVWAAGSDGMDGPTDAAGAWADGNTIARAREKGINAIDCLERNDSYAFFEATGSLIKTGLTGTNVMDIVLLIKSTG